jgi:hypothetical protein
MAFSWFRKKKPEIDPSRIAEAAFAIVDGYGEFLERNPCGPAIRDEKRLPHPKEMILTALVVTIATGRISPERREALAAGAWLLAHFQKGVGDHPVYQLGFDISQFDPSSMSGENMASLMLSNPAGKDKYDRLFPLVQADMTRINRRVTEAERMWAESGNIG